jgi:hypothetical protein
MSIMCWYDRFPAERVILRSPIALWSHSEQLSLRDTPLSLSRSRSSPAERSTQVHERPGEMLLDRWSRRKARDTSFASHEISPSNT